MKILLPILGTFLLPLAAAAQADDFPQWRGSNRTGVIRNSVPIAESWASKGPGVSWESETFPQKCGYGSPVIAGEQAFLYINWRSEIKIPHRRISKDVLRRLNWFDQGMMPPDLLAAMERPGWSSPRSFLAGLSKTGSIPGSKKISARKTEAGRMLSPAA